MKCDILLQLLPIRIIDHHTSSVAVTRRSPRDKLDFHENNLLAARGLLVNGFEPQLMMGCAANCNN